MGWQIYANRTIAANERRNQIKPAKILNVTKI
jgi:hypothetical protein